MTTILMTFTNVSWNKGSAAQVSAFVAEVRKVTTDVEFVLLSHSPELDRHPASMLGIRLVGIPGNSATHFRIGSIRLLISQLQLIVWGMVRRLGLNVRALVNNPIAMAYAAASVVADFSGDSFRDWPGGVWFAHNVNLIAARVLGKPVVLISQSIGPFRWHSRWLSRRALNSVALIYIRERHTEAILKDLDVTSRIALAPDIAFLLPPSNRRNSCDLSTNEALSAAGASGLRVGISTSHLLCRLHDQGVGYDYLHAMAHIIEYVRKAYDATVFLIPHEIKAGRDDRVVSYALAETLGRPAWLTVIDGDHHPSELRDVDLYAGHAAGREAARRNRRPFIKRADHFGVVVTQIRRRPRGYRPLQVCMGWQSSGHFRAGKTL